MSEDWGDDDAARRAKAEQIDTTVPNAARVIDFMYGGQNNFEADRRAAQVLVSAAPVTASIASAIRGFQQRALSFLSGEAGIRQFIDIGTGLPLFGLTHQVVQAIDPTCRVVYVDDDPMVLSHARALLRSAPGGAVGYVDAPVGDCDAIMADAAATLDLGLPVAVLLLFTLAFVTDNEDAAKAVAALMAALPPGSYAAIYHLTSDRSPAMVDAARQWNKLMPTQPITLRSWAEVDSLMAGLDVVLPGVVPVDQWRPLGDDPVFGEAIPVYGAVARKP